MKNFRDLTRRDQQLLELVGRYRLGTDGLFRLAYFPHVQSLRPVRKVARRLVERRYLREYALAAGEFYYVRAPRGARAIGVKPAEPRPFTEQSLPGALAVAWYCLKHRVARFTAQEFVTQFPDLTRPGLRSSNYFVESDGSSLRLGLFLTDRGTTSRRMLAKIRKVITKRYAMRPFASLIQAGRFTLVVLTGYAAKQEQLQTAIALHHRGPVAVHVVVVPDLGSYLTSLPRHEAPRRDNT